MELALMKRKTDLAHWKRGKLLGVVPKIDFGTISETLAITARVDRRRIETETHRLNIIENPYTTTIEKPYTLW